MVVWGLDFKVYCRWGGRVGGWLRSLRFLFFLGFRRVVVGIGMGVVDIVYYLRYSIFFFVFREF